MQVEVSQAVFLLKIARVPQAGFADVDRSYVGVRLAQRVGGRLRGPTAGDQDGSVWPRLLGRPQQQGQCPAPIRVAIELAMPIEVAKRRRVRVNLVKGTDRIRAP